MREGNELLQAVKEHAYEDRGRSWRYFIETWVALLGLVAGTIWAPHWSLQVLCSVLAGLVHVRMFILFHDFAHGAFLRGSAVAQAMMNAYGIFLLSPPNVWRRTHNYHHKHNAKIAGSSIGSYPVMTTADYAAATPQQRKAYAFARSPLAIALGYWTMFLDGMCLKSLKANPRAHWDSGLALVVHLALVVTLALWSWQVLMLAVLMPLVVVHAGGAYLFYVQHNFPAVELRNRQEWDYVFAALRSSSFFKMSKVMHWFTGNIGYHHVHHLNPRIPFYRLPEVMALFPELQAPGETSWHPRDVAAAFELKLWDPDQHRMVGFPSD